jgi:hypothetical protein
MKHKYIGNQPLCKTSVSEKLLFSYSWKLASVIEHTTFLNVHFLRSSGCVLFKESEHYFSVKGHRESSCRTFGNSTVRIHIPCFRLIIRYLIQMFAQSVINSYLSRSSYIFIRLQGHYHGGIYKGRQVQQIPSKMRTSLTEIALLECLCTFLPDDDFVEVETYRRNKSDK